MASGTVPSARLRSMSWRRRCTPGLIAGAASAWRSFSSSGKLPIRLVCHSYDRSHPGRVENGDAHGDCFAAPVAVVKRGLIARNGGMDLAEHDLSTRRPQRHLDILAAAARIDGEAIGRLPDIRAGQADERHAEERMMWRIGHRGRRSTEAPRLTRLFLVAAFARPVRCQVRAGCAGVAVLTDPSMELGTVEAPVAAIAKRGAGAVPEGEECGEAAVRGARLVEAIGVRMHALDRLRNQQAGAISIWCGAWI